MNPPKAPTITPEETVVVNLDVLTLPESPFSNNMSEINTIVNDIVTRIEANEEPARVLEVESPRRNTMEKINETYGTFATLDEVDNKCCPTCGVHSAWHNVDYSHRICVPGIGPAKPQRFDNFGGVSLRFNFDIMSAAEKVSSGSNIFRCQTVCSANCALCMEPCQEQGPSAWSQFTGWDFCHATCWVDLCWRYHTEYLEPNDYVNTLGRFLVFLEE